MLCGAAAGQEVDGVPVPVYIEPIPCESERPFRSDPALGVQLPQDGL